MGGVPGNVERYLPQQLFARQLSREGAVALRVQESRVSHRFLKAKLGMQLMDDH
jgi:hypothetical protein